MFKNKHIRWLRLSLLALFTILITAASIRHITLGGGKAPSIHALCPYGALESLYQLFTSGTFISKIYSGTFILLIISLGITLFFRRSFCGAICPFGAIQEYTGLLGSKIIKRRALPQAIDRPLRFLKYFVLALTLFYAWKTAGLWMAPYDPWSAYAHLYEGLSTVWTEAAIGLILLGITLVGSFIYDRFFCKYLCPMGAFLALVSKLSPYKVTRNKDLCIDCGLCTKSCPMNIDVQHQITITDGECINCSDCVVACPQNGALENKFQNKTISPLLSIILVITLFFGSIIIAQVTGVYTLLPDQPQTGEHIEFNEIRGFMTISEAAASTNTDIDTFYTLFEIPKDIPSDTMMKKIEQQVPLYDFDSIKERLSNRKTPSPEETSTSNEYSNIKGSMTIQAAAETTPLDLEIFYSKFKIPSTIPPETLMRDIGNFVEGYDFHTIIDTLK